VADSNYNVNISGPFFEWDERKAALNKKKHGLSFEEAKTAFYDEDALLIHDPEHSEEGLSARLRIAVVCHAYRKADQVVRIISARKATRGERRQYRSGWLR
jgi:uncharacterized protein